MRVAINIQTQSASPANIGGYADVVLGQPCFTINSWSGASDSTFSTPGKVAIDPTTGKVFVVDNPNHRVLRWNSANAMQNGSKAEAVFLQNDFSSSVTGVSANTVQFLLGDITVDYLGNLYVVDVANARVLRFNNASSKVTGANADAVFGQVNLTTGTSAYTVAGNGPSYFSDSTFYNPISVTTDKYGNLYVADFGTEVIMRFDSAYLKPNGAKADGIIGSMNFTNPYGGGRATDSTLNAIGGLCTDKFGNLYVADFNANRVLRFDNVATAPNGLKASAVFGQFDFTDSYADSSAFGLNRPNDVCADTSGNIYIMDSGNNRVVWIDSAYSKGVGAQENGVIGQNTFGKAAYGLGQNVLGKGANHVSFDPTTGKLWISDNSNNRILRFGTVNNPSISDSLALVALYNSTNGGKWKNNTNWLTGPLATWYGVMEQCGAGSPITGLNLSNNNLSDSIPVQFITLSALQTLKLDSNNITYIPNLTGITTLNNLQIEGNAITFESIEPNISITTINYSPEDSVFTKLDTTIVQGDSISFSSLIGGSKNSYQWYKNNQPITGATSSSFTLNGAQPTDSGTYTCQVTNSIVTGLAIYRNVIKLSVKLLTVCNATANAGPNQSVCQGKAVTLQGTVTGTTSFSWSTNGTGTFNPDTTSLTTTYIPTAADLALDSLTFVLTADSATCPPVNDTIQVTILSTPTAAFVYTKTCLGHPEMFIDSSKINSGTINQWYWKFGDGDTSSMQSPSHKYTGSLTNYMVTLSVSSLLGCTDSTTQLITFQTPATANAGANQSICQGKVVILKGVVTGAITVGWSTTGTGTFNPDTAALTTIYTPSAADFAADSITFTLTADSGVCPSVSDSITVTINNIPTAAFTYAGTCLGVATTFTDKSTITSGTLSKWNWSLGDGNLFSIQNPSHTYSGTITNFTVSLAVTSSLGCTDSIAKTITFQNQPVANAGSDETICAANIDTINLSSSISGATGGVWASTGSGYFVPDSTSLSTIYQLSSTDLDVGYVTFTFTTTGNGACQAVKSTRTVTFDKSCLKYVLMIPTGISPNGDGKNDYFVIKGIEGYPQNALYIYDQNGFQLFSESNYQNDWAGTNQSGQELVNGTYYYAFDVGDKKLRGFVEIRR